MEKEAKRREVRGLYWTRKEKLFQQLRLSNTWKLCPSFSFCFLFLFFFIIFNPKKATFIINFWFIVLGLDLKAVLTIVTETRLFVLISLLLKREESGGKHAAEELGFCSSICY